VCHGLYVTRHTSHVTRLTSHVTRHTSYVTRHTSHVTRHTSHVTRHTPHVTRQTSHVTRHTSHVTHHTSHVTRHTSRAHANCYSMPKPLTHSPLSFVPLQAPCCHCAASFGCRYQSKGGVADRICVDIGNGMGGGRCYVRRGQ